MSTPKVTFLSKEESKAESLRKNLAMDPAERVRVFLQMSEFYLSLIPPREPQSDQNFHIYP